MANGLFGINRRVDPLVKPEDDNEGKQRSLCHPVINTRTTKKEIKLIGGTN